MSRVEARRQFVRGATEPSVLSVSVAVAVVALVLGGCLLAVSPALISTGFVRYLASTRYDYDAFVTSKVFALQRSEDERPLVALVGASVTRMSFGTERDLDEAIRAASGVEVEAELLCTGRQNYLENTAIIEEILSDRPMVIVLGVAPGRFSWRPEAIAQSHLSPRLGFRSVATDREAPALGLEPYESKGNYFLDNADFLLPRMKFVLTHALLQNPVSIEENRYTGRQQLPAQFEDRSAAVAKRFGEYEANFDFNADLLRRLVDRVRSFPNAKIVFVEEAINPVILGQYLEVDAYERYLARMAGLAEELQVPYWQISREAEVTEAEFFDWAHINNLDARERMRTILANNLAEFIQ